MILIGILCFGILVGVIARFLVPGSNEMSWGATLVIGLAGSLVGGLVLNLIFGEGLSFRPAGIIGSILGAMVLVAGYAFYSQRMAH